MNGLLWMIIESQKVNAIFPYATNFPNNTLTTLKKFHFVRMHKIW